MIIYLFLSLPSVSGEEGGDPDEDVDGVQVDPDAGVDGVEGRGSVAGGGVALSLGDDLLGVVEQECAEQDQSTVHGHAVQALME